ncbi:Clp protease N-terminal domain-containing protein [Amycolatopsis minnesotensis]|uniref:Clp R domain-containing protein n=1 Tax=Amycolatopsis minnesotensis TaxID=337894 RepID=A0ABP5DM25_9PSEU
MPKINVYLPDELAESVKETGLPVSAICQQALELSVRRVTAIRSTVLGDLGAEDPTAKLVQFTERARTSIRLGIEKAREAGAPSVGTEHLLHGVLAEGSNLALQILPSLEVDPGAVAAGLPVEQGKSAANRFSGPAANALELTVVEAISLGHNYVGCEHLLLGLLAEPDGTAGEVLRGLGVDQRSARRAVVAALTGYAHLQRNSTANPLAATIRAELKPVLDRLTRLERHTGLGADD